MIYAIERNDPVFKSVDFLKDAAAFNVMISIAEDAQKYPHIRCFSDGSDCIVLNSDKAYPVAVWTSDRFKDYESLCQFLKSEFADNTTLSVISKEDVFRVFHQMNEIKKVHVIENVYVCTQVNEIAYDGHADNIQSQEISQVSDLLALFYEETGVCAIEPTSKEKCDREAKDYIDSHLYKVWRNSLGKIVALGRIVPSRKSVRVGRIITKPEERGKSYAKMLVHFFTEQILKEGKTAVLLADANYAPSNKCYQAVGYQLTAKLAAYTLYKADEIKD